MRLALDSDELNCYLEQFLFHVTYRGDGSRFFLHFSKAECVATLEVLRFIESNMARLIHERNLEAELTEAIGLWSKLARCA